MRASKHTGFQDDLTPPFRCAPMARRPAPAQRGPGKLVTRILATALGATLVVFFTAQYLVHGHF